MTHLALHVQGALLNQNHRVLRLQYQDPTTNFVVLYLCGKPQDYEYRPVPETADTCITKMKTHLLFILAPFLKVIISNQTSRYFKDTNTSTHSQRKYHDPLK